MPALTIEEKVKLREVKKVEGGDDDGDGETQSRSAPDDAGTKEMGPTTRRVMAYADNFKTSRIGQWTH